jgi:hypothetical protein
MFLEIGALLLRGPRWKKRWQQIAGLIRVSTYLTLVGAVSSFFLVRAASARLDEAIEHFGETLVRELGPELIGQTQEILVNGQRVFFSTQITERTLSSTLDELQRHCESRANPALSAIADLPPRERERFAELGDPRRAVINRAETADHVVGQVACLAHAQDGATLEQTLQRVFRFIDSGDLSEIGDAHYFVARELEGGRTQVLSIWTEGKFDIVGMFPSEGDAPGSDSTDLPRPPSARRTFAAVLPQQPYTVRVYESRESREVILAHYDELMTSAGWVEQPTSDGDELRVLTRAFSREDRVVFVVLDAARDGETPVTLVEVGGQGVVQVLQENR